MHVDIRDRLACTAASTQHVLVHGDGHGHTLTHTHTIMDLVCNSAVNELTF